MPRTHSKFLLKNEVSAATQWVPARPVQRQDRNAAPDIKSSAKGSWLRTRLMSALRAKSQQRVSQSLIAVYQAWDRMATQLATACRVRSFTRGDAAAASSARSATHAGQMSGSAESERSCRPAGPRRRRLRPLAQTAWVGEIDLTPLGRGRAPLQRPRQAMTAVLPATGWPELKGWMP